VTSRRQGEKNLQFIVLIFFTVHSNTPATVNCNARRAPRQTPRTAAMDASPSPEPQELPATPSRRGGGRRKSSVIHLKTFLQAFGEGRATITLQFLDETHPDGGPFVKQALYVDRSRSDGSVRIPVRPADLSGSRLRAKHLHNTRNEQP